MRSFLDTYLKYTRFQSSPESFHWWAGVFLIASVLDRRVWVDMGYHVLYPNIFILLVAPSGKCMKSTSIKMSMKLFNEALPDWDYKIPGDRLTPEALIEAFRTSYKDSGKVVSALIAPISEFSTLFGDARRDPKLLHILTDIYDCPPVWSYKTIGRGASTVYNPYLNVLSGTTPSWLRDALPAHTLYGGFSSRILFVCETEPRNRDSAIEVAENCIKNKPELERLKAQLVADLKKLAQISGVASLSPAAVEWYIVTDKKLTDPVDVPEELSGYFSRRMSTLVKIAICCCVQRTGGLVIEPIDLMMADERLKHIESHLGSVVAAIHTSEIGQKESVVKRQISSLAQKSADGWASHSQCLRGLSRRLSSFEFNQTVGQLVQCGEIRVERRDTGKARYYQLVDEEA